MSHAGIAVIGYSAPARKNGRIATAGTAPTYSSSLAKRLASVSAQLRDAANALDLQSGGAAYFVTKAVLASDFLQSMVSFYFEPKSTPVAHVFVGPNYKEHTSLIVTLVGVLETA